MTDRRRTAIPMLIGSYILLGAIAGLFLLVPVYGAAWTVTVLAIGMITLPHLHMLWEPGLRKQGRPRFTLPPPAILAEGARRIGLIAIFGAVEIATWIGLNAWANHRILELHDYSIPAFLAKLYVLTSAGYLGILWVGWILSQSTIRQDIGELLIASLILIAAVTCLLLNFIHSNVIVLLSILLWLILALWSTWTHWAETG